MIKRFLITSSLLCSLVIPFSGCEDNLQDKYYNPEQSTTATLSGLFTGILDNDRVRPSYWNVRTFLLPQTAAYSQTAFLSNSGSMYQQSDGYVGQYWGNFYVPNGNGSGVLGLYRSMEAAYAKLSDAEKARQEIFMQAARVVLYDQASQMVDLWGDIPFSEAGSLQSTSTIANPKFDDQQELYTTFLNGLKEAAAYFASASSEATFSKADILLKGDIDKWEKYANSIRLRLLMRISNANETTAKTEVMNMLNNSSQFPLVDGSNLANYNPAASDILLPRLTNYIGSLNNALTEVSGHLAPDYMLNTLMLPADDPRIPVMFDKFGRTTNGKFVPNQAYKAMPVTFTEAEQDNLFQDYSILDSATFLQNTELPGIVITASEVNFLKAEAQQRWGTTEAAKAAYETALKQSVTFYYYLNSVNSTGGKKEARPSDAVIEAFATTSASAYTGSNTEKLAAIWNQKWLHFSFLQSVQAWSEYRRTGYPVLTFPTANLSGYEAPPTRLLYPSNEKSNNAARYAEVQAKDTRSAKLFWDKN